MVICWHCSIDIDINENITLGKSNSSLDLSNFKGFGLKSKVFKMESIDINIEKLRDENIHNPTQFLRIAKLRLKIEELLLQSEKNGEIYSNLANSYLKIDDYDSCINFANLAYQESNPLSIEVLKPLTILIKSYLHLNEIGNSYFKKKIFLI